jgi:hypothetical protein
MMQAFSWTADVLAVIGIIYRPQLGDMQAPESDPCSY